MVEPVTASMSVASAPLPPVGPLPPLPPPLLFAVTITVPPMVEVPLAVVVVVPPSPACRGTPDELAALPPLPPMPIAVTVTSALPVSEMSALEVAPLLPLAVPPNETPPPVPPTAREVPVSDEDNEVAKCHARRGRTRNAWLRRWTSLRPDRR